MDTLKEILPLGSAGVEASDLISTLSPLSGTYASNDLYERYLSACEVSGHTPATKNAWARRLTELGFPRTQEGITHARIIKATRVLQVVSELAAPTRPRRRES